MRQDTEYLFDSFQRHTEKRLCPIMGKICPSETDVFLNILDRGVAIVLMTAYLAMLLAKSIRSPFLRISP